MKLYSWNVNGIRACVRKGAFYKFIEDEAPDILCLQEVRATPEQAALDLPGYNIFWLCAEKKGYSGTAVLTKTEPLSESYNLGVEKHDHEGRVITLEYPDYYLVTVYTPNSQRALTRLDYRTREWDVDFLKYLRGLEKKKPVVFCGDLNVAHQEIDLTNPKENERNAGFTAEERSGFDNIVKAGFIDTFREFEKGGGHYTWWSNFARSRERNIGWRIDYFCISGKLRPRLKGAQILPHVMGSDHCPVSITLD